MSGLVLDVYVHNQYSDNKPIWNASIQKHYKQKVILMSNFSNCLSGEDLMKEFVLYASGAPLLKTHIPKVFSVYLERIWRMINAQPEFEEVSTEEQLELISNNSAPALALIIAKAENCSNGLEQAQEGNGYLDELAWKETFLPLINGAVQLKKMSMLDAVKLSAVELTRDDLDQFNYILSQLEFVTSSSWIYKLALLLILTRTRNSSSCGISNAVSKLHTTYMLILQRRLNWMFRESKPELSVQSFLHISNGLRQLESLSNILMKIISSS